MFKVLTIRLLLLGAVVVLAAGCKDDPVAPPVAVDQFATVRVAVDTYLSSGMAPVKKAQDVRDLTIEHPDTYILSVRGSTDYAIGHIPSAVNIPWRSIADTASLSMLPKDKDIYVYCYTGHTAQIATTVLNALGYSAYNMKYGIMSWTRDAAVRVQSAFSEVTDAHDYNTETTVHVATAMYDFPDLNVSGSSDASEIIRAAAFAYVSTDAPIIKAPDLFDILLETGWQEDNIVVSVRSAGDYAVGHIPGAINIPWREVAKVANLKKLDPAKRIIIYCYTGHTGQVATTALNMLGYDAVNLKHGIMAWTRDATVRVQNGFDDATDAHDYPTESSGVRVTQATSR